MKNFILFAFICFTCTVTAQDYSIAPNPIHEWEVQTDIELLGDAFFTNNSNEEKTFTWERTIICEENVMDTWFCDPKACYLPSVGTQTFTRAAGEGGAFQLHVNFTSETERALVVEIKVYENGDEANAQFVMYELNACAVGVDDVELNEIKLFPNPATDHFTLTNAENVDNIVIHNLIGAPVKKYQVISNRSYSISDLPTGVYMVQLYSNNGSMIGTKKVFKSK